jgi:peptidoglycan-N-acetylglucosamine deacetylase
MSWSEGKTAVSFTYDDGHGSNLDNAIPALEKEGWRGTFFLTTGIYSSIPRSAEWKAAFLRGHEIGNHTVTHPCDRLHLFDEDTFSREETGAAEHWLNTHIEHDDNRTYSYICGINTLGGGSKVEARDRYHNLVKRTFSAGRGGEGGPATAAVAAQNPIEIPACALTWGNDSSESSIAYLEEASTLNKGWAILVFHDIVNIEANRVAETRETSTRVHDEIIAFVRDNSDRFFVDTFRNLCDQAKLV